MLTVLVGIISNSQVFLLKNVSSFFLNAKATHMFSAKILAYMLYLHIFNSKRCNFPYIMRIADLWFLTLRLSLILSYILRRYVVASLSLKQRSNYY